MAEISGQLRARSRPVSPLWVTRRVVITFALMVLAACIVTAVLLLNSAERERHTLREHALTTAITLSFAFDQEVAAGNALLRGLSKSPALQTWDPKLLYDQFIATPIPPGSWLIASDLERQLVNTLMPFGANLPKLRDFPNYPEALNRVRDRGWTVSGRMSSLVNPGKTIIALGLRVDSDVGSMKGFISTILAEDHLRSILATPKLPQGWWKALYDRKLLPIVTDRSRAAMELAAPTALAAHLETSPQGIATEGVIEGTDEHGAPILIAFRHSAASDWTSVVGAPLAAINAPLAGVLHQMVGPAVFLALAGALLAVLTARHVQRPLTDLSLLVSQSEGQVSELSDQMLGMQENERQRIARELHDSTAQSLVAAGLHLARLEQQVDKTDTTAKTFAQVSRQLESALQELRVFTYLLHPPSLAEVGLKVALEDFIDGFSSRTGLSAQVRIADEVNELSPMAQRSMLRVMQEALANVHRHSGASQVRVAARRRGGRFYFWVMDDGRGIERRPLENSGVRPRLGVGIPGMRVRLRQLNGDLRITSGAWGTSVLAYIPATSGKAGKAHFRV